MSEAEMFCTERLQLASSTVALKNHNKTASKNRYSLTAHSSNTVYAFCKTKKQILQNLKTRFYG